MYPSLYTTVLKDSVDEDVVVSVHVHVHKYAYV